jgi:hypothetical protein
MDTSKMTLRTAAPGYAVIEVLADDSGRPVDVSISNILSWAHEQDLLIPHPVTLCGVQLGSVHIVQPDGSVERANADWYPSVADWLAAQQSEHDEREGQGK